VSFYEPERLALATNSHQHYNYNQRAIELEISFPRRDSDKESEQQRNQNLQGCSDQVQYSPEHTGGQLEKQHQLGRQQEDKHKVELHRSSIDSSFSTLTDRKLERASSFSNVLIPPLSRIRLPTIASARSSDVDLQYSNSTSNQSIINQGIIEVASARNSIRFGNFFTSDIDNRNTRISQTSIRTTTSASIGHGEHHTRLRDRLRFTRTRNCLVFLIAAQVTALIAYACAVGAEVIVVVSRPSM